MAQPVLHAFLRPVAGDRFTGKRLSAFAVIGRPEKFFSTLRELHAELVGTRSFPDHYPYRARDIDQLLRAADGGGPPDHDGKDIIRVPAARGPASRSSRLIRWAERCSHRILAQNRRWRSTSGCRLIGKQPSPTKPGGLHPPSPAMCKGWGEGRVRGPRSGYRTSHVTLPSPRIRPWPKAHTRRAPPSPRSRAGFMS